MRGRRFRIRAAIAASGVWVSHSAVAAAPPVDPDFPLQWGLHNSGQTVDAATGVAGADIDALDAWNIHTGGSLVTVAIVGSGVNPHPEFADRLLEGFGDDGDPYDARDAGWSGTHMAGIIAAAHDGVGIAGMHPEVRILPVRAVGGNTAYDVAIAVAWAADNGADIIVVTHQFYSANDVLADAINHADAKGVLLIAPAGHVGDSQVAYPARYPKCLAVAPTDNGDQAPSWANFGAEVDIAAPGERIWSTLANGAYGFESVESSALAAAYVAGVASLMLSYDPELPASSLRQILIDTADDLGLPGLDPHFGHGRVNAGAALQAIGPRPVRFGRLWNLPEFLPPGQAASSNIKIFAGSLKLLPETAAMVFRALPGGVGAPAPLQWLGGNDYSVAFAPLACGTILEYYLTVETEGGYIFTEPQQAPVSVRRATSLSPQILFADDFENDLGWETSAGGPGTTGLWSRVAPNGTAIGGDPLLVVQPGYDRTPNGGHKCYVTGQHTGGNAGANDVDLGPVQLLSPVITLTTPDAEITYARWFVTHVGNIDHLKIEFSRDGGAQWTVVEEVTSTNGWEYDTLRLSEFPGVVGDQLRLRFITADIDDDSLTEAGVDEVVVRGLGCGRRGDADGNGLIDLDDWRLIAECMSGPGLAVDAKCQNADLSGDGSADQRDAASFQNLVGTAP